jgi:hypothetical protein
MSESYYLSYLTSTYCSTTHGWQRRKPTFIAVGQQSYIVVKLSPGITMSPAPSEVILTPVTSVVRTKTVDGSYYGMSMTSTFPSFSRYKPQL